MSSDKIDLNPTNSKASKKEDATIGKTNTKKYAIRLLQ
jgi:hypothetical protein